MRKKVYFVDRESPSMLCIFKRVASLGSGYPSQLTGHRRFMRVRIETVSHEVIYALVSGRRKVGDDPVGDDSFVPFDRKASSKNSTTQKAQYLWKKLEANEAIKQCGIGDVSLVQLSSFSILVFSMPSCFQTSIASLAPALPHRPAEKYSEGSKR